MISASVGFQCPECVAQGRQGVRPTRTVFGGKVHSNPGLVTSILVGACVAIWVLQIAVPSLTGRLEIYGLAVASGQWYRLVTAGFLHLSIIHILFNMWALWVLGRPLEAILGRIRFVTLYFTALVAGSTASYLFSDPLGAAAGASGAIFGLAGGLIIVARRMNWNFSWLVGIVALNFLLPFTQANIDWHAHVGGFIAGLAVTAAFTYPPRDSRTVVSIVAVAVMLFACVGLVAQRTTQIRQDPTYGSVFQVGGTFPNPGDYRPDNF
jgi:membrane associated rhomboid family serine protease